MRPAVYSLRCFKLAHAFSRVLPRTIARKLGAMVALQIYQRQPAVQSVLRSNLTGALKPGEEELPALCRRNVAQFGAMLADYFRCAAGCSLDRLMARWKGMEHIEAAREASRGVILVTAHLGHWELGGLLLAQSGLPVTVVTLEEPESELTRWRDDQRRRAGVRTVAVGPGHPFSFLEIVQALRRNEIVAMLVDRPAEGSGVPVTFFGGETEFSAGPALLWQHTGAAIVPAFVTAEADQHYSAIAEAPLEFRSGPDSRAAIAANTQIVASHFESVIRSHPTQWFNYSPVWNHDFTHA